MRRFAAPVVWACAWLSLAGFAAAAEVLRVATYNVENYVAAGRRVEGVYRPGYPKPEDQKAAVRAVLRTIDADVVALQEMGPEPYLEELKRDLRAEGLDYPHHALLEAADAERHVAVLSKRPLAGVVRHTDLTFKYDGAIEPVKRGLLEVRIAAPGGDLTFFIFHLKSRLTDRQHDPQSARRREGEAVAIRERVLEAFPNPGGGRFVMLGDCNDGRLSRPVQALRQRGRTDIVELLPAADTRGETWTYCYRKEDTYTRVDHIFVSAPLTRFVEGGRAHICDVPETRVASDHRPVWAVLRWE